MQLLNPRDITASLGDARRVESSQHRMEWDVLGERPTKRLRMLNDDHDDIQQDDYSWRSRWFHCNLCGWLEERTRAGEVRLTEDVRYDAVKVTSNKTTQAQAKKEFGRR